MGIGIPGVLIEVGESVEVSADELEDKSVVERRLSQAVATLGMFMDV